MSKETFTPRSWNYKNYLIATGKEDTSESKDRWQQVVWKLNNDYIEELQTVVSLIISHIDEEELD